MDAGPLVSVVTPSYNQGQFISQTIESVLGQEYPRLEYLVVDGASTDNTLEVLKGYGSRLRWISERDRGQSSAINKGWRQTRGEIIGWLCSDDTYLPGAIARVAAYLQEHPDVDLVYGDCDYVDEEGRKISPYPTRPYEYRSLVCSTWDYIPQPATFFRRRLLESVGYLDEDLQFVMDLDFWLRVGVGHTMRYIPGRLATYRIHPRSKTIGSVRKSSPELLAVYKSLFARPDLPRAIRRLRGRSLSNAYYRAANYYFLSGDVVAGRQHAIRGWQLSPMNLRRVFFKIVLLSWLGQKGVRLAYRVSLDPVIRHAARRR